MKKIWIFNHYATNMYFNKGGRHYWFAKNLIKENYEPIIFCANERHNTDSTINIESGKYKERKLDDIPFVFVKTTKSKGNGLDRVKNMGLFAVNLFSLAASYAKKNGKPDIIIASSVHPLTMISGIMLSKKMKVPCICEIRDLWPETIFLFNKTKENSLLGKVLIKGEHWIYRNADALIFTKEGDTDYIKEKKWDTESGGDIDLDKAHYINNGVDIGAFNEAVQNYPVKDDKLTSENFNVVYVGAIRPVNNVGNILDAAALLKEYKDIQFHIYGDGSEREMLEKRISKEGLTNVKMNGHVEKKHIPYILSKSSVNLLNYSSTQYNWARGNSSNKLFEYMASGKPVISNVKMGYSIINRYDCGIELDDGSSKDLANAILKVKKLPTEEYLKLGQNAKKAAVDFDFKVLSAKLISIIENI